LFKNLPRIDPYAHYIHRDGHSEIARKWALSMVDFQNNQLYASFDHRLTTLWLEGGVARMHPALARLYFDHNFEYQSNENLGAPPNRAVQPISTDSTPTHLTTVTDTYCNDMDYNKSIRNDAQSFALRTHTIMPFFQTLLPEPASPLITQPTALPTTQPTTQLQSLTKPILKKCPRTDTTHQKNDGK
jgi:hypothetical protein